MRVFLINAKRYEVPPEVAAELDDFIANIWKPRFPPYMLVPTDLGTRKAKVPSNLKSLSFSCMLSEWANLNWREYIVKTDIKYETLAE